MSKLLANQIANYGDDAPIEIKEGLNIPAGKPIQAAGSAGSAGQVLSTTGTSIEWVPVFDGNYNSLSNRPTIPSPQVNSDWNATSGVAVILNKPVVPPQSSVTTAAAGTAALSYNSTNGEFTFTPPDLSSYATEAWVGSQSYLTAEVDTLDTVTGRGSTTTNNIQVGNLAANGLSVSDDFLTLGNSSGTFTIRFSQSTGTSPQIRNSIGQSGLGIYGAYNFGGTHSEDIHLGTSGVRSRFKDLDPQADLTYDLGSSTKKWDNIYAGKLYYSNNFATIGDLPNATTYHGMFAHVHAEGHGYFAHGGAWTQLLDTGSSIGDLADVNLAVAPQSGQVLAYDGANWVATAASGGGGGIALTDLSVSTASAGTAALSYNNVSGVFTFTPPDLSSYAQTANLSIANWDAAHGWGDHGAQNYLVLGSTSLSTLNDCNTSGVSNGDVLSYNGSEWQPAAVSYTETDTLDSVTGRGATTTNNVSFGNIDSPQGTIKAGNNIGGFFTGSTITADGRLTIINRIAGGNLIYAGYFFNSIQNTFVVDSNANLTLSGSLTAGGLTYPTTNGTSGQVLTSDGAGNVTWSTVSSGGGGANVSISDTAPGGASAGDLWWESDTGRLKIYYQDTDSTQWVDANPPLSPALSSDAPTTASSNGTAGDIRYDADYVYICIATNTWKRAALATW